jgi:signal peptidase
MESNLMTESIAKRSSSETLLKRSAPTAEWNTLRNDDTEVFAEMIEEVLNRGHSIRFRAPGDSMYPTICNGDFITVIPIKSPSITNGDIILYQHRSGVTAHRVISILKRSALQGPQDRSSSGMLEFILRGDAAIESDAPVRSEQILGKVISIERNGHRIDPYCLRIKLLFKTRRFVSFIKRQLRRLLSRSA